MKRLLLLVSLSMLTSPAFASHGMSQAALETLVRAMADSSRGGQGVIEFDFNNVRMYLISDVEHNRMRIVAPVAEFASLTSAQLDAVLVSSYHGSLDARYAVSEGVLYSAYIHSLAELNEGQVRSAVRQVSSLALSFSTEYSSGALAFNGDRQAAGRGKTMGMNRVFHAATTADRRRATATGRQTLCRRG